MTHLPKDHREDIEYNVGDIVWWAKCENEQKTETCPICFGKCAITVILGNDEAVQTPCGYCDRGMSGSKGYVQDRYEWSSDVKNIPIEAKEINERNGDRSVEYRYNNYILRPENIFQTKEAAEKRVLELIAEQKEEEQRRIEFGKEQNRKSYAWHVGYHRRCAKDAKRQLEYHEKKIIAMQKKSKLSIENQ